MKKAYHGQKNRQIKKHEESSIDMDPYSTSIIDELLNSTNQWKNQDQIVKLTFKAFKDFIDLHSNQIKDLKSLLTTRAAKHQVSTGLSLKANVSDLTQIVEQISKNLDSKITYNDINTILGEYARKKQLNEVLMQNEIKNNENENGKLKQIDRSQDVKVIQARFQDFQKQICKKLGNCVTLAQLNQLTRLVQLKANICEINQVLDNRVTKQYFSSCLSKKISKSDLESIMAKKADVSDIELIINSLEMKASLPTIQKLTQILQNKADRSDILIMSNEKKMGFQELIEKYNIMKLDMDNKIYEIHKEIERIKNEHNERIKVLQKNNQGCYRNFITNNENNVIVNELKNQFKQEQIKLKIQINEMQKKLINNVNYQNFKRELVNEINLRKRYEQKIYEQIDGIRKKMEQISIKKIQKNQYFNFKSELAQQLDQKIQTQHVQEAFNKWEIQITQKIQQDKEELFQLVQRVQQTLTDAITQNAKDINQLMTTSSKFQRLDYGSVQEIARKSRREIDQFRKTVDSVYNQLRSKLDASQYETDLMQIRKKFDNIQRQYSLKANIKDVCVLADSKPNVQDINKALKQIKQSLQTKTSEIDLQQVVKDQGTINQTLLCQNIVGRWLWLSGQIKSGGLIPWEVEFANTVPDYYFWEKDKSSVLVLISGIYQITTCLFGRNTIPNLIINGEGINGKQNENVVPHNGNKKHSAKRKKDKESVGNKISEFIMLPARSRISVTTPLEGAEGFLNVRRL